MIESKFKLVNYATVIYLWLFYAAFGIILLYFI